MTFCNDGLTAWYDTPDAPAPPAVVAGGQGAILVVGAHPANAGNAVTIRYSVDGQRTRELPARPLRTEYRTETQYFQAVFPALPQGERVNYLPILSCAGRQAPACGAERLVSSFQVASAIAPQAEHEATPRNTPRFAPRLDFVGRVTVQLRRPPEAIGACPDGLRINFTVERGTVVGPDMAGSVRAGGRDSMIIRQDGVGVVRLRAVIEMEDGALIAAEYEGLFELGEEGYQRAVLGRFPAQPPLTVAPRFVTAAPKYEWMNRVQFMGVGQVTMSALLVAYDLYAVRTAET